MKFINQFIFITYLFSSLGFSSTIFAAARRPRDIEAFEDIHMCQTMLDKYDNWVCKFENAMKETADPNALPTALLEIARETDPCEIRQRIDEFSSTMKRGIAREITAAPAPYATPADGVSGECAPDFLGHIIRLTAWLADKEELLKPVCEADDATLLEALHALVDRLKADRPNSGWFHVHAKPAIVSAIVEYKTNLRPQTAALLARFYALSGTTKSIVAQIIAEITEQ